jgi:hypothetical protein
MTEVGKDFVIPDDVVEKAKALGIGGDVRQTLLQMVKLSAPFSQHPRANRRYEGLMLRVENNKLSLIDWIDFDPVKERYRQKKRDRMERLEQQRRTRDEGKTFIDLTRK